MIANSLPCLQATAFHRVRIINPLPCSGSHSLTKTARHRYKINILVFCLLFRTGLSTGERPVKLFDLHWAYKHAQKHVYTWYRVPTPYISTTRPTYFAVYGVVRVFPQEKDLTTVWDSRHSAHLCTDIVEHVRPNLPVTDFYRNSGLAPGLSVQGQNLQTQ